MTELQRARAHLRECQKALAQIRKMYATVEWQASDFEWRENNVLASLSWVWEEQKRSKPSKAATVKRKRRHRQFGMWRPLPKFKASK